MTRKNLMISAAALSLLVLAGCSKDGMAGYIGTAEAKNVALENAGLTASQVKFTDVELDDKNGTHYYQVEFTADGKEYEYDIDALTGAIIESKLPAGAQAQQNTASNNNTAGNTTPDTNTAGSSNTNNNTSNNTSSGTGTASAALTADQAKNKALAHAGLKANQVTFVKSKLDWDDGRQVYDVEFYTNGTEYDYEINAETGAVLSFDHDLEWRGSKASASTANTSSSTSSSASAAKPAAAASSSTASGDIGADKAKSIALAHAGLSEGEVDFLYAQPDRENGRQVYDVEFYAGGVCFSYGEERGREQFLRQEPYPQDLSLLSEGGAVWHSIPSATFYHAWSQSGELPDGFQAMFGAFF